MSEIAAVHEGTQQALITQLGILQLRLQMEGLDHRKVIHMVWQRWCRLHAQLLRMLLQLFENFLFYWLEGRTHIVLPGKTLNFWSWKARNGDLFLWLDFRTINCDVRCLFFLTLNQVFLFESVKTFEIGVLNWCYWYVCSCKYESAIFSLTWLE